MATEEIVFRTRVDTGNSAQDIEKAITKPLGEADKATKSFSSSAEKSLEDLNKRVNSGELNYKQLTRSIKDYQSIALAAGRTSPIGQEALQQAATLRDKLTDLDNEVKRLAHDGQNMQAALAVGTTVVAGYGAVRGATALLGIENESLQKTMVKLQGAQAILNGLEAIRTNLEKESVLMIKLKAVHQKILTISTVVYSSAVGGATGAMKLFRIAMLAIPIVAIIAGIAALVAALVMLNGTVEIAESLNNRLTESITKQNDEFDRASKSYLRNIDNRINQAKAEGATQEELHVMELDRLAEQEKVRGVTIKKELIQINQRKATYKQALKEGNDELATQIKDEIAQSRIRYQDLKSLDGQYQVDKKLLITQAAETERKEDEAKAKERASAGREAFKRLQQQRAEELKLAEDRERLFQDILIENIEDANLRTLAKLELNHKREVEATKKKHGEDTELLKALEIKQAQELQEVKDGIAAQSKKDQDELDLVAEENRSKAAELERVNEKARLDGKLIEMRDDFNATQALQLELAELEREFALEQKDITEGEKFKIEEEYKQKVADLNQESADKEKALNKEVMDARIAITEQGLGAIQSLSDILFLAKGRNLTKGSKQEEQAARKQFNVNKAMQLGGAIIDGSKAVMSSLASSPVAIGPIPNPAGIASLAFVGAKSIATIASIAATKFEGGSASSPSVGAPSIPSTGDSSGGLDGGNSTLTAGLANGSSNTSSGGNGSTNNKVVIVDSEMKAQLDQSAKVEVLRSIG
jgi:hypothetical protein